MRKGLRVGASLICYVCLLFIVSRLHGPVYGFMSQLTSRIDLPRPEGQCMGLLHDLTLCMKSGVIGYPRTAGSVRKLRYAMYCIFLSIFGQNATCKNIEPDSFQLRNIL